MNNEAVRNTLRLKECTHRLLIDAAEPTGTLICSSRDDLSKSSVAICVHGVHAPHVGILSNNPVIDRGAAQYNQNVSTRIVPRTCQYSSPLREQWRNGYDQKEDAGTTREYGSKVRGNLNAATSRRSPTHFGRLRTPCHWRSSVH